MISFVHQETAPLQTHTTKFFPLSHPKHQYLIITSALPHAVNTHHIARAHHAPHISSPPTSRNDPTAPSCSNASTHTLPEDSRQRLQCATAIPACAL